MGLALRHPALILFLLGGLAFSAVAGFDLVWDDLHFLHPGSVLAHALLPSLLASDWSLEGPRSGYYRPVVTVSLALETRVFGGSPAAYHLMNLVYHLGAALALVWAALRIIPSLAGAWPSLAGAWPSLAGAWPSLAGAWLAGLVFVVHPIHTESVAWVSGRTDVIATLFFCLAVGCYARAVGPGSPWMLGATTAAAGAFLSKEPAIVLPAVLVAWELCRPADRRGPGQIAAWRLLPIGAVAAGYLALRHLVLGTVAGPLVDSGVSERLATGVATLGRYFLLLVAPFPPNPDPVLEPLTGWSAWQPLTALSVLLGLGAAALLAWRRSRLPAFLLAWFLLTLLPSTPLLPVGPVHMAERFLYLPSAAFALALGAGAGALLGRAGLREWADLAKAGGMRGRLIAGGIALLLVGGLCLTVYRNEDWRDAERLFTRMAASSPRSWKAANGLGHVYEDRGQLASAAVEYRRAMALRPGALAPVISLALVESRMGLHEQAKRRAEETRRLDPDGGVAIQVAWIHSNAGEHDAAAAALAAAAAREPWRPETRFHHALALARAGRRSEAREALADAERLVAGVDARLASWRPIAEQARVAAGEARP